MALKAQRRSGGLAQRVARRFTQRIGRVLAPVFSRNGSALPSIAAIALGVALGYAVQLINGVAAGEFEAALRVLSGSADLSIHGPRSGFDESVYAAAAALPETAAASPVLELEARPRGRTGTLKLVGIDVFRAALIQPELAAVEGLGAEGSQGRDARLDFLRPDRVFLSRAAAQWLDARTGDEITLQSGLASAAFTVAGILSPAAVRERVAVLDIAAAQAAFGRVGSLSSIELRLRPGADVQAVAQSLARELPPGLVVERPQARVERSAMLSRAYRVNLNVLAMVALFTGSLLVFSSQALAVVRRRAEFALLRALGITRAGIVASVLAEAAVLGILGALPGVAAGHALAQWVLSRYGAGLGASFFRGLEGSAPFEPLTMAGFVMLGVAAALAGSWAAATEAARAQPAQALRAGDEQHAFSRLHRVAPGAALMAAGAALCFAPPVEGLPIAGYAAIALLLLGALLLMPRAAQAAFRAAPGFGPAPARLALAQLRGAPGPAGVSLAAIVASVALMASMAIMVFSFRQSLDDWLGRMLPADLYARIPPGADATLFTPALEKRIAALPGVARAEFTRVDQVLLDARLPPVTLLVRTLERDKLESQLFLVEPQRLPPPTAPPPAWVSEAAADLYGLKVGSLLEIPVRGRGARFTVAGIWRDYVRQQGAVLIERAEYQASGGASLSQAGSSEAALWLAPGASTEALGAALRRLLPPGAEAELSEPGELRELSLRIFDRTFGVTYALEAAAVLIGLFALAASFGALALARRREFGVLRHVGMTRAQVGAMLAFEGTLVSAVGLAAGLALGWLISVILVHVVNRQSFHWSMDMHMPWQSLGAFALAMLVLASVAAWAGARRAMGVDAVRAVSEAW
jgi:putative ABC transport system permease protein